MANPQPLHPRERSGLTPIVHENSVAVRIRLFDGRDGGRTDLVMERGRCACDFVSTAFLVAWSGRAR